MALQFQHETGKLILKNAKKVRKFCKIICLFHNFYRGNIYTVGFEKHVFCFVENCAARCILIIY